MVDDNSAEIDIFKIYNDYIKQIDAIRSYVGISNGSNLDSLDEFINNNGSTQVKAENSAQESRCSAFFRLLGLPIASNAELMYNPGYNPDQSFEDLEKIKQTNKDIVKKGKILNTTLEREKSIQFFKNVFSIQDIVSSVYALSSIQVREFASTFATGSTTVDNFFNIKITDQVHSVNNTSYSNLNYKNYVDFDLTTIDTNKRQNASMYSLYINKRRHILRPFMPDPRVVATVMPQTNQVCIPFLATKDKTKFISQNNITNGPVYLFRPILEQIIRDRFDSTNYASDATGEYNTALNFYLENKDTIDSDILNKIFSNSTSPTVNTTIILKYFNVIRAMVKELIKAQSEVADAEIDYVWVPVINKAGIEYGITTRNIVSKDPNISDLQDCLDKDILNKTYTKLLNDLNSNILGSGGTESIGNFPTSIVNLTSNPESISGVEDSNETDLNDMTAKRKNICDKANKALQKIEIIMGEFSGLGFCDILATNFALYQLEDVYLLRLLDNKALDRMKKFPNLRTDLIDTAKGLNPIEAIVKLENAVEDVLNTMQSIYKQESTATDSNI